MKPNASIFLAAMFATLAPWAGAAVRGDLTSPAADPPMSLEQSIRFALQNSPLLKSTEHHVNATKAAIGQARALQDFNFSTRASLTKQGPVITSAFSGTEIVPDHRYDLNLILTRPLWAPGLSANRRLAEVTALQAEDNFEVVRQELIYATTGAYLDVLRAQLLREVTQKSVEANRERLRIAEAMFKAGNSPKFDVLRAEVQLAAASERLAAAHNGVEVAKAFFNNELGRPAHTPVNLQPIARERAPTPELDESMRVALTARPELASTQKQIAIGAQKERAAQAGKLPTLNLSSAYNRQSVTGFSKNYSYSAQAFVSIPVFDGGLARHQVRQAREEKESAQQTTEQTRQRIELDVKRAVLNLDDASVRIDATSKAVAQAEEALRIASLRYQTRLAPIIEVLDAEVALTQARNNEINAWFDYAFAQAQWRRAVGKPERSIQRTGG